VAGVITLLASVVPVEQRPRLVNPASLKQVLVESAIRLDDGSSIFEQGQGRIDVPAAAALLMQYTPRASIVPPRLDTTDCPYMWPYCAQPLFYGGVPLMANLTVLNGMAAIGWIEKPTWHPEDGSDALIDVAFEYSAAVWPWSGYFAVHVSARAGAAHFKGVARGLVTFNVTSPPVVGMPGTQSSMVALPLAIELAPVPPREYRLLWDQFHSLAYPGGFFPRDSLRDISDPLDWHGDHPSTNFKTAFMELRARGYFIDVLGHPFTCFNAKEYGALLIVDSEDYFFEDEIAKVCLICIFFF
jgi:membrane-bound transcription factor site-1 protease